MSNALRHRGPDDGDTWVDQSAGVVLTSRRLAILDLSPSGHQPMTSRCQRYVTVYNGEVYNFHDLRDDLEHSGRTFVGNSDTEVLLEACARWGIEGTLHRLNGMFSFALWDRQTQRLTLARDRLGVKPLYYGWCRNTFWFGSELKALHALPGATVTMDIGSVALFLRLGYIPTPYSIYKNTYQLSPGHFLTVPTSLTSPAPTPYWSVKSIAEHGINDPFKGSIEDATDELELLLRDSVRLRMLADVPVGAFLSGGIDSSLVVALMRARTTANVKTFTIGFRELSHNEADHARQVARHLGTEHTELLL